LQQRLSTALVWLADAIAFLSRTVWPLVDLLIRIWIGRQALVLSVLISTDWAMAVSMATGSYPIPVAGGSTALLSLVYWLAAVPLILGLATRVGAATLLALAVASHIRVAALDLNLFWMALLAYYVLLGADRLSLDRLVSQGLKSLAQANRHIAELMVQIVRQRVIVKYALDAGQRSETAESLLHTLEKSLGLFEKHRALVLDQ